MACVHEGTGVSVEAALTHRTHWLVSQGPEGVIPLLELTMLLRVAWHSSILLLLCELLSTWVILLVASQRTVLLLLGIKCLRIVLLKRHRVRIRLHQRRLLELLLLVLHLLLLVQIWVRQVREPIVILHRVGPSASWNIRVVLSLVRQV